MGDEQTWSNRDDSEIFGGEGCAYIIDNPITGRLASFLSEYLPIPEKGTGWCYSRAGHYQLTPELYLSLTDFREIETGEDLEIRMVFERLEKDGRTATVITFKSGLVIEVPRYLPKIIDLSNSKLLTSYSEQFEALVISSSWKSAQTDTIIAPAPQVKLNV